MSEGITRERIVEAALGLIAAGGLAAFSMRRLADELDVRVNTIYWHVPNKQELLAAVGERIVGGELPAARPMPGAVDEAIAAATAIAGELRRRMLAVRDGGEIVALARAKHPGEFAPARRLAEVLTPVLDWGAAQAGEIIAVFVIGATIEEQTRRELVLVDEEAAGRHDLDREGLVGRGLEALLVGLVPGAQASSSSACACRASRT